MSPFQNEGGRFFLVLVLLFFSAITIDAQGDYEVFSDKGMQGLKSEGQILIQPNYEKLGWTSGFALPVGDVIGYYEGAWGLITVKDKKITPPKYYTLEAVHRDLIVASLIGKLSNELLYGAINSRGETVVGFRYHSISQVKDLLIVSERKRGKSFYGLLSERGASLLPVSYADIKYYTGDLFIYENAKEKKGLIHRDGTIMADAKYDSIGLLQGQYSTIVQDGMLGLLDSAGHVVLEPRYKEIDEEERKEFGNLGLLNGRGELIKEWRADSVNSYGSFLLIFRNQYFSVFDKTGKKLLGSKELKKATIFKENLVLEFADHSKVLKSDGERFGRVKFDQVLFDDHYLYGCSDSEWEIYNSFGRKITKRKYDSVKVGSDNLIPVMKRGFWGFLDHKGEVAIVIKYDEVSPFKDRLSEIRFLEKKMLINQFGDQVGDFNYDSIAIQSNNTAIAKKGSRIDLLNGQGIVLFQTYNELINHELGFLEKTESERYGLVSKRGSHILEPWYDKIEFREEFGELRVYQEGEVGIITLDGTWLKPFEHEYENFACWQELLLAIKKDKKWGFVNKKNQLIIANRYDSVGCFITSTAPVLFGEKWGMLNEREEIVVQPNLDEIVKIGDQALLTRRGNKYGLLDLEGGEILPIEYDEVEGLNERYYLVRKEGKTGVFNHKGLQKIPVVYDLIQPVSESQFIVSRRGLFGVVDINGQFQIPLKYSKLDPLKEGFVSYLDR